MGALIFFIHAFNAPHPNLIKEIGTMCNKNRHTSIIRSPLSLLASTQFSCSTLPTLFVSHLCPLCDVLNVTIQAQELWQDGDISFYLQILFYFPPDFQWNYQKIIWHTRNFNISAKYSTVDKVELTQICDVKNMDIYGYKLKFT